MSVIVVLREGPHAKSWPPFSGQNEGTAVLGRPAGTRDLCSDVFPAVTRSACPVRAARRYQQGSPTDLIDHLEHHDAIDQPPSLSRPCHSSNCPIGSSTLLRASVQMNQTLALGGSY